MNIVEREISHPDITSLDLSLSAFNAASGVAESIKFAFAAYDGEGEYLGSVQGRYRLSAWAEMNLLSVVSKNSGVGTNLYIHVEKFVKSKECKGICLSTLGNQAEGFYKKMGFNEYARLPKFSGQFDRIFMKKEL